MSATGVDQRAAYRRLSDEPDGFRPATELAREQGIAVPPSPAAHSLAPDRVDVVRALFRNSRDQLSDAEIAYVLSEAARTGLDPVRQLAAWRDKHTGKIIVHTRIDGLLAIAERTRFYRGTLPTRLTWAVGPRDSRKTVVLGYVEGPPAGEDVQLVAATCGVLRDGFDHAVEATRFWADCAPKEIVPGSSWDRSPSIMLEKDALAAALRRAFPQDLAGIYETSELRADEE